MQLATIKTITEWHTLNIVRSYILACDFDDGCLGGLVPGKDSEVVGTHGSAAPLLVRAHHQPPFHVVAALLTGSVVATQCFLSNKKTPCHNLLGHACGDTVLCAPVVETLLVSVHVALKVWGIAAPVHHRLLQQARTLRTGQCWVRPSNK